MTIARRFGTIAGSGYVAAGLLGFALTGFSGWTATSGSLLVGIEINPLHNLLHLAVGVTLLVGAAIGAGPARILTLLTAASYGVAGLFGLALVGTDANVLALNDAGNVLHFGTALVASVVAWWDYRAPPLAGLLSAEQTSGRLTRT